MRTPFLLTCALLAACTSTQQRTITTVQPGHLVRLAVESTEARACVDRCTGADADSGATAVMSCLAACPGAERRVGHCGPNDQLPAAMCVAEPETTVETDEAGACAERRPQGHVACHDHAEYHADGRIWLWILSMVAVIPVIAFENR